MGSLQMYVPHKKSLQLNGGLLEGIQIDIHTEGQSVIA